MLIIETKILAPSDVQFACSVNNRAVTTLDGEKVGIR